MRFAALSLALAAAACRPAPRGAGRAGEGLHVVIHASRQDAGERRAHVDDRRWLDVPRDGWLDIPDVDGGLTLDSVVVDSVTDPGGVTAGQCHRVRADRGVAGGAWLVGHDVTFTTAAGATVRGRVTDIAGLIGVIRDDELGEVEVTALSVDRADEEDRGDGTLRSLDEVMPGGGPVTDEPDQPWTDALLGRLAAGRTRDGDAVYGPLVALRAASAHVRTPDGRHATIVLGTVARLEVAGVSGAPTLRCRVRARRPGRQLVRAAYASDGFGWSASYRAVLPPGDDASLTSIDVAARYTIEAPALATARLATVELVAGLPDGDEPPAPVWRGEVRIGGGPVVVHGAPEPREARLGWVYRGAIQDDVDEPSSEVWRGGSHSLVWRELALAPAPGDLPGPIELVIDAAAARAVRGHVPAADPARPRAIRLPIATSATLFGFRRKRMLVNEAGVLADEILYSVSNRGDAPVRVTIEEELRDLHEPRIRHEKPDGAVELRRDRWRRVVEIAPGGIAQGAVVVQYRLEPRAGRDR